MANVNLKAKEFITPLEDVSMCEPNERLSAVVNLTRSTHDPVFVFDKKDRFEGLVSVHQAVFTRRYPLNTKVKNALIMPPRIHKDTPLHVVAQYMIDTKLYTLPVFDKGDQIVGVISSPMILSKLLKQRALIKELADKLKSGSPVTIEADATVKDAHKKFRDSGRSRLIVVKDNRKVEAVISRRDLQLAFNKYRKRERFATRVGKVGVNRNIIEEEIPEVDVPVIEFAVRPVQKLADKASVREILQKMVEKKVPSIILQNKKGQPTGLVSTRSYLEALAKLKPETDIPILYHHPPAGPAKDYRQQKLDNILQRFGKKLNKKDPVERIELSIEEPKNQAARTVSYNITLRILLWSGETFVSKTKTYIAKAKHIGLETGVREAIKEIDKQLRREEGKRNR